MLELRGTRAAVPGVALGEPRNTSRRGLRAFLRAGSSSRRITASDCAEMRGAASARSCMYTYYPQEASASCPLKVRSKVAAAAGLGLGVVAGEPDEEGARCNLLSHLLLSASAPAR